MFCLSFIKYKSKTFINLISETKYNFYKSFENKSIFNSYKNQNIETF